MILDSVVHRLLWDVTLGVIPPVINPGPNPGLGSVMEVPLVSPELVPAGFSYPSLVEEIRKSGLTAAEIARITGVRERQVQNWASGSSRPGAETRDRLVDIHYIIQQLQLVYRPEGIEIWLHARNPELGGERPIEMLVAGDFQPVVDAVDRLQVGAN